MDGILPLWKNKGLTSHDCVWQLRKILGTKKVGHTGTLDPAVEGVLPICIGQATKVAEYITDSGKEYIATVSIGTSTETEDAEGAAVLTDVSEKRFHREDIQKVLHRLTGLIEQTPPMYSAVKVNGRKLYEYARKGIEVERPKRYVNIHDIKLLEEKEVFAGTDVEFTIKVICGKGTYIRTLAVQIGEALGFPAHMSSLVRTGSGTYRKEDCLTLEEVKICKEEDRLNLFIRPLETALTDFKQTEMDEQLLEKVIHGQVLPVHPLLTAEEPIVFTENGKAVAVYQRHPEKAGMMKPQKMFLLNR